MMYNVNIMALSSDPGAYMMGMGGGAGDRRRRQTNLAVNTNCILPGGDVNVDTSITTLGTVRSLDLTGLSESLTLPVSVAIVVIKLVYINSY